HHRVDFLGIAVINQQVMLFVSQLDMPAAQRPDTRQRQKLLLGDRDAAVRQMGFDCLAGGAVVVCPGQARIRLIAAGSQQRLGHLDDGSGERMVTMFADGSVAPQPVRVAGSCHCAQLRNFLFVHDTPSSAFAVTLIVTWNGRFQGVASAIMRVSCSRWRVSWVATCIRASHRVKWPRSAWTPARFHCSMLRLRNNSTKRRRDSTRRAYTSALSCWL